MAKIKKILLIGLVLRLILVFVSGFHPDILNHVDWGLKLWEYGTKNFYEQIFWAVSWPNQPLGSIILFGLIAKIFSLTHQFLWFLNLKISFFPSFLFSFFDYKLHIVLLKLPFILSDIGIGYLIYKIINRVIKKESLSIIGASLFLFNPGLVYNSAIWGQTDSLINLLALFGIWHFYQKNFFRGFLGLLLSLYFKLSLIIWSPVVLLIFLEHKREWKKVLTSFSLVFVILLAISFPFVHHGNVFSWLWYLYTNRVLPRQGNMLSGNAFNLWTLVYGIDLSLTETALFLGIKAKLFGRLLTILIMVVAFLVTWKNKKKDFGSYLWLMTIYSFASFLFLTNMHERYLYPVFAPLIILLVIKGMRQLWYWLLTIIYILNLYNLWWYPQITPLRLFLEFNNFLVPRVLSFILIVVFGVYCCLFKNENLLKGSKTKALSK